MENNQVECGSGKKLVIGEGPLEAKVMLIGQNPGAEEEKQGRPFVGRSGRYLNIVLKKNNIERERLYITSVVKYRTPDNRKPTRDEIEECLPMLRRQIEQIKPQIIVLMGEVAKQTPRYETIRYLETYHPSAAMRFPKIRMKFEADLRKLAEWLS